MIGALSIARPYGPARTSVSPPPPDEAAVEEVLTVEEALTSEETVERIEDGDLRFERVGTTELQGVGSPSTLYRMVRA